MRKKNFSPASLRHFSVFAFAAALFFAAGLNGAFGQNEPAAAKTAFQPKETETEEKTEPENAAKPSAAKSRIKITFDENAPGVVMVESNGEKIRVDANAKTVEQLKVQPEVELIAQNKTGAAKNEAKTPEQEESVFDFEEGEEPYDYHLINVPTPKKVPRGSFNLAFTHRFSQPIHPVSESGKNLLGLDSFSVSSLSLTYGITDKLYAGVLRSPVCQRGLCRTIEIGVGYNWIGQSEKSQIGLTTYASIEGNDNFTEEYTYNLQTMISARPAKRLYLFFSPAVHFNSNGQQRFNPRAQEFFPPAFAAVNNFKLPKHGASYGFGASFLITPNVLALFEFTPRTGFKLGNIQPVFDNNFNVTSFKNTSYPEIAFGIQRNIGKHSFTLTFSNTQTTTTSRYNSSNLALSPKRLILGFNLFRRFN